MPEEFHGLTGLFAHPDFQAWSDVWTELSVIYFLVGDVEEDKDGVCFPIFIAQAMAFLFYGIK